MSTHTTQQVRFEIGHVLYIDIIEYSKLLINQQSEQLDTLRNIARDTEEFRAAEAEGKLLRLPTGDGGALVFRTHPEAPVLCAFTGLGNKEEAIDALGRACADGAGNDLFTIRIDPMLEDLRGQPRFEALAEKIVPAREFRSRSK